MMTAQILLDRAGHSPGVIDGYGGGNTSRALRAFEKAQGLEEDGELDDELLSALREQAGSDPLVTRYTLTQEDVAGSFRQVPADMAAMAERDRIGYSSASELLAEKFHMSEGLLAALNPDAELTSAGTEILVVQVGSAEIEGTVARIEIDKSASELRAYDSEDNLLASFPATVGSSEFPSPSGAMEVSAIAMEANYTFDPGDQDWGGDEALTIPPGPNNPIGGVWIDLGKDGYGIHGTSDPSSIAKSASHGCVRLTNWDARALARAVESGSTKVAFN
ncbi:MAG: L,D-transpeptidase [Alphaproteobacteria bacterium]|nr:L,D-transpeptidase [Alphaproteobacteria bacterium]